MTRLLTILIAGFFTLGFLALDTAAQDKKGAGKKHQVIMEDDKFKPDMLTIAVGDTVVWVNKGNKTHAAASGEGVAKELEFDTDDVEPGKTSKPFTFKKEGKVPYNCIHHDGMKGVILVKGKGKAEK